jgi:hypothetical protein
LSSVADPNSDLPGTELFFGMRMLNFISGYVITTDEEDEKPEIIGPDREPEPEFYECDTGTGT